MDNIDQAIKTVKQVNLIKSIIVGLLIGLLLVLLINGCHNSRTAIANYKKTKHELDSLTDDYLKTTQWWNEQKNRYTTALQLANGQIEIYQNREQSYRDSLDKASNRISLLLAKHTPIKPNTDTSITVVPSEYVADCENCFTQLQNGRDLVIRANNQRDSLDQAYKSKISLQDNRISELGQQNKNLQATLTDAFEIAKKDQEKNKQTRKLYLTGGTMAIGQYVINSIGGGLGYQDLRWRLYSISAYGSKYGAIYMAQIYFPLSLKRR